jgi:acetoin utilization deacetylase AcuC-like enzyme
MKQAEVLSDDNIGILEISLITLSCKTPNVLKDLGFELILYSVSLFYFFDLFMTTQIAYSEAFQKHNNPAHPENAQRLRVMMEELRKAPFFDDLIFIEPTLLKEESLYHVHSDEMIQQVKQLSQTGDTWIDMDTYVCQSDYDTARLAAGGLLDISMNVLKGKTDNGFALIRPPGHHATHTRSMGFCLFNNAAITAHEITKTGKKVLIFDHDVHHGNGTQDIFYNRNDVIYQSLHLFPHYPGTGHIQEIGSGPGKGFTINAPLTHGNGDNAVSKLLDTIFLPIAQQFKPDIILISTGYDSHHADVLGGLRFTTDFFAKMIAKYQIIQPKIVCTLEGGYNLQRIGKCLASQLGQLTSQPITYDDTTIEQSSIEPVIEQLKNELDNYWRL